MERHFITFFSPGTMVSETTKKPINSWDIDKAVEMAREIKERYGSTPYGFVFTTNKREDHELDSKEVKRSSMHYLGGTVRTLAEVKKENNPSEKILISNMEINEWKKTITNNNSWQFTAHLSEDDIVVPFVK